MKSMDLDEALYREYMRVIKFAIVTPSKGPIYLTCNFFSKQGSEPRYHWPALDCLSPISETTTRLAKVLFYNLHLDIQKIPARGRNGRAHLSDNVWISR